MRKNKLAIVMMVMVIVVLSGCKGKEYNTQGGADTGKDIRGINDSGKLPEAAAANTVMKKDKALPSLSGSFKGIKGKIKNVFYLEGNKVMVEADSLVLYDIAAGKTTAKTQTLTDLYSVQAVKDGYAVVGEDRREAEGGGNGNFMQGAGLPQFQCVFYDKKLKQTASLSMDKISGNDLILTGEYVAISADGKKIAYVGQKGMYIYDVVSKTRTSILEYESGAGRKKGIINISQLCFSNDSKGIAFAADSIDTTKKKTQKSFDTCGFVNTDGSGLVNQKPDNFSVYQMEEVYDSFVLFSEDFRSPSGSILRMDIPSGKFKKLKTEKTAESATVFGSDGGKYYASATLNGLKWTISIYETSSGKLKKKLTVTCKDVRYTYQAPRIRILDNLKACIVLLGRSQTDYETQVSIRQFK